MLVIKMQATTFDHLIQLESNMAIAWLVLGICLSGCWQGASDGAPTIIDKIRTDLEQYQQNANCLQGEMTEVMKANGQFMQKTTYRFRQNVQAVLLEQFGTYSNGTNSHSLFVFNSKYGFYLARRDRGNSYEYYLVSIYRYYDNNATEIRREILNKVEQITKFPAYTPLQAKSGYELKLNEYIQDKLVKVSYSNNEKGASGWIIFDLTQGAMPKEKLAKTVSKDDDKRLTTSCTKTKYEYIKSGRVYVPNRILFVNSIEGSTDGRLEIEKSYNVSYDPNVSEYDFTLSAYGMLEPDGVTWERPRPWWIYFGLAGVGCLVGIVLIGVFLRRRYGAS